ncbi:hypothetical protein GCM10009091_31320 [Pseudomonas brenneri]|nr:hypothetical protein GCM10009091_31320 [Pseudomonas brenneri]
MFSVRGAELKSGECYCQLAKARSPKGEGQVLRSPVASNEASALLPVGRPGRGVANEQMKKMRFAVMKTSVTVSGMDEQGLYQALRQ